MIDWQALWLTLQLGCWTTVIVFLLGLPLAYWLASGQSWLRTVCGLLLTSPIVLPPTVLGFYLLVALGPRSPVGQWCEWTFGQTLPFTFPGLVTALVIANLPYALRPFVAGFARVERQLVESAWCLGASRWRTFWRITFPLAMPGIVSGLVLVFAHAVGEFGVVLMVGGNRPGITRTLSIAIYEDVQALDYARAWYSSLVLLTVALVALGILSWAEQRLRKQ
jgi:molybdate transport system permease protein